MAGRQRTSQSRLVLYVGYTQELRSGWGTAVEVSVNQVNQMTGCGLNWGD